MANPDSPLLQFKRNITIAPMHKFKERVA